MISSARCRMLFIRQPRTFDYYYIKYLCEHVPGGLLGPIRQLTDEELEALMPWSEEYKAYEKHQIETSFLYNTN